MSFFHTLKQGQLYLNTWPQVAKLGMIFPENRIIKSTKFAQRIMPFVAVFSICWWVLFGKGMNDLSAMVITAVFALCIPFQDLYWLGKRANKSLPTQSAVWFDKISEQLKAKNIALPQVQTTPNYLDFARILKLAEQKLEQSFWDEL
ncbi:hypothetical protein EDC44_1173 [Cricetibacter osteomyelitidis]|uniref:UPF0208 membrane protein YfbV n=1 Tax=Cricetibacter osteomyelitidis TaxID=1521931 RepID=A0A4V2T1H8_9PAST|nr:terminus macrodomain insulation protein YfbV [Cricetibacter osteomyelitidis]TCP93503.1 hypothetical protein EDC44_1173 [Cricetibacter osteomyelitidis]